MSLVKITGLLVSIGSFFVARPCFAELPLGVVPVTVELKNELGGRLDGSGWSSSELTGKVFSVFYVDPDEKDTNNAAADALKKEAFDAKNFASVAIINMAATWAPNFAIQSSLEKKQKEFPQALYLRDNKKVLVDKWKLKDDSSNIMVFGKDGKVLFAKDGKLSTAEVDTMIKTIKDNL
jgi:YtfJ family uncharacterized protein